MNVKKLISIIAVAGIVIATAVGVYVYFKAFTPNTQFSQNEVYVYIPTNSTYEQVAEIYQNIQNGARHKAYILKGLKQDLTAPELLLRACKCISELTDDTLFYKQAKTYIEKLPKTSNEK